MESALLKTFEKKDVITFRKDLMQMLAVIKSIDKDYMASHSNLDVYINKLNPLIDMFNKKYRGIKFKLLKRMEEVRLRLFTNEKNIQECFANSASKIIGLQSIGRSKFGAAGISDTEAFTGELEKAKDRMYITYYNPETGHTNVFLHYDKKEKKVELVYDPEEIANEPSPEFQIAAFYALSHGHDKKIGIQQKASVLGFSFVPYHAENAEHLRKFDPHMAD